MDFIHGNLGVEEARTFTRSVSPYARAFNHFPDEQKAAVSEGFAAKDLIKKHGIVDGDRMMTQAKLAIDQITKNAPGLKRLLVENGAGTHPEVMGILAKLARAKGWK